MTTTDLEVIDDDEVEVIEPDEVMSKRDATSLNKKIQACAKKVADQSWELLSLLETAATGSIHVALGYASWPAWFSENVGSDVGDRDNRKRLNTLMSGKGMSQRAIAASLGVDQKTVSNDLRESGEENSSPVIGLDGKTYTRPEEAEEDWDDDDDVIDGEVIEDDEAPARREPLPAQMTEAVDHIVHGVNLLTEVTEDDRFIKARKGFATTHLEPLQESLAVLQEAIDKLAT